MNNLIVTSSNTYRNNQRISLSDPKPEPKPKFSAIEKARKRASQNRETGQTLGDVAKARRDAAAEVTADLLKLSGYEKANGELTNLVDKKGRVYSCAQSLISANTRLDVSYQIKTARRHRKRVYEAFQSRLSEVREHNLYVSFLTPTFPNLLGVGFADNDRFQARAWELFLQMKIFGEFFYAGFSKTEWTLGGSTERAKTGRAFDLDKDGINYHSHVLCINYKPFAAGETSQLESRSKNALHREDKALIRNSLRIVTAWTNCLRKAHRQIFGKPLKVNTKSGRVRFTFQNVKLDEIKAFDIDESRNGVFWEIAKTASYTAKGNSFKGLTPELLLDAENTFKGKRIINPFGVFRKQVQSSAAASQSLVNQPTKQSESGRRFGSNILFDNILRGVNEPLKNYGIRLCSMGLRETWLQYLETNKDVIVANRRNSLLERFPNSVFTDLTGQSYYGWQAAKLLKQKEKESHASYDRECDSYYIFKEYQRRYFQQVGH